MLDGIGSLILCMVQLIVIYSMLSVVVCSMIWFVCVRLFEVVGWVVVVVVGLFMVGFIQMFLLME